MKNDEVKDIVPDLFDKIDKTFKLKAKESKIIKDKLKALKNKKADYKDANEFAVEVGKILADTFQDKIKTEDLPDGKMYYNIAKRLIEPNMVRNHDLVSEYSKEVQSQLNKKANISIKAQKADLNQDRIDKLVDKITKYDSYDDGKWLLNEPIINFSQSVVDETIKKNANLHYKSGLNPKIIRKERGNCCDWCKEIVGTYSYPDVPEDIYRRHRHCRCTVDYFPGDGKRQDVWSKKWKDIEKDDKIKERIERSKKLDNSSVKRSSPLSDNELIYQDPYENILKTKNYLRWEDSLTNKEKSAILSYTSNDYYEDVNGLLRGTKNFTNDLSRKKKLENIAKTMNDVLSRFETEENYTVYRGTYARYGVENVKLGEVFVLDKGFSSSSFAESITEDFSGVDGDVLYRIRVPKGKKVGAYIDKYSTFKGEEEFLFKPNTKFRLLKIDSKEVDYGKQWVYDLEAVE